MHRVHVLIIRALVILALAVAGAMWLASPAAAQELTASPEASPVALEEPAAEEFTGVREVTVGFYLTSIYGLDQQASTYYADFYMWMKWSGDFDPTATVELLNNIERWGLTMTPIYEEPAVLPTGEFIQQFHMQGQFFQPLSLNDFPLDSHGLSIWIEDSTYQASQFVYVLDQEGSGVAPDIKLPGWTIEGWELTSPTHAYATGFGETASNSQEYATALFTLNIERPQSFFVWKLLLPLIIVLLLGCSVLLVHPSFTEVRLAGPATALLTLVFLQQTYSSSLPDNGSLVLLDKIYALAYALVIGLICTTIVTSHWVRVDEEGNSVRAVRLDRMAAAGLFALFLLGTAILVVGA